MHVQLESYDCTWCAACFETDFIFVLKMAFLCVIIVFLAVSGASPQGKTMFMMFLMWYMICFYVFHVFYDLRVMWLWSCCDVLWCDPWCTYHIYDVFMMCVFSGEFCASYTGYDGELCTDFNVSPNTCRFRGNLLNQNIRMWWVLWWIWCVFMMLWCVLWCCDMFYDIYEVFVCCDVVYDVVICFIMCFMM